MMMMNKVKWISCSTVLCAKPFTFLFTYNLKKKIYINQQLIQMICSLTVMPVWGGCVVLIFMLRQWTAASLLHHSSGESCL